MERTSLSKIAFNFPELYHLPPFFTLQSTPATREKQMNVWATIVIDYCRVALIERVDSTFGLWTNESCKRRLDDIGIRAVMARLVDEGAAMWTSDSSIVVYPKPLGELCLSVTSWIGAAGLSGAVYTPYELSTTDPSHGVGGGNPLRGVGLDIISHVLECLEDKGAVERIFSEDKLLESVKIL